MSAVKKRLLLIDGHSMAYRAFYALPAENFKTSSGQPTNAIYGFASMIINLVKEEKPTHIAVAFDVSRKTFRTEKFPEYKATRASTPDEFRSQLSYINDYHGVRITKNGQLFRIEKAIVWNIIDRDGIYCGQAATFADWIFL